MLNTHDDLVAIYDEVGDDCIKRSNIFKVLRIFDMESEDTSMIIVSVLKGHTLERKDLITYLNKSYQIIKIQEWREFEDMMSLKVSS